MKKNLLKIGFLAVFAALLFFNLQILTGNSSGDVSLKDILKITEASAGEGGGSCPSGPGYHYSLGRKPKGYDCICYGYTVQATACKLKSGYAGSCYPTSCN